MSYQIIRIALWFKLNKGPAVAKAFLDGAGVSAEEQAKVLA